MSATDAMRGPRLVAALALGLALLVTALYLPVLGHGFLTYDDDLYVTANDAVLEGLTPRGLAWSLTSFHAGNWHPLTWISHMLDVELFGRDPRGHHATNLLLHAAATLALFLALAVMTGAPLRSAFVAALFGVHPLNVESVAWVAERKNVLSTLLGFVAVGAYASGVRRTGRGRLVPAVALYALSLGAKQMLVTLPALLLLLDRWPLGRWEPGRPPRASALRLWELAREKWPFFLLAGAAALTTFAAQTSGQMVKSLQDYPATLRLGNALISYLRYLGKAFLPTGLASPHVFHRDAVTAAGVAAAALALGALTWWAARLAPRRPYLLAGWLWFLVALLPVIGVVQLADQSWADRYSYVPHAGLYLLLAWGGGDLVRRSGPRWLAAATAGAILLALVPLAWRQIGFWRNDLTLFERTAVVDPGSYLAQYNLGAALAAASRADEAARRYEAALRLRPDYPEALNNLGTILATQGRLPEAIARYRQAVGLNPRLEAIHANLASALQRAGDREGAERHYRRALDLAPESAAANYNLGVLLLGDGRLAEAAERFRRSLRLAPRHAAAHNNLGVTLLLQGDITGARDQFQEALGADPGNVDAARNLERLGPLLPR